MSKLKYGLLLLLVAGYFLPSMAFRDSAVRNASKFSVLLSLKPLFNSIAKDSAKNYMYSHNLIELQYRYRRHQIGIGFDGNNSKSSTTINNLPKEFQKTSFSIAPNYAYNFFSSRKWSMFVGAGYFKHTNYNRTDVISQIEIVTNEVKQTENGGNAFFRLAYNINKFMSVEMEMSVYLSKEKLENKETYSLNTGMNASKTENRQYATYAFPSNFWLKFNF